MDSPGQEAEPGGGPAAVATKILELSHISVEVGGGGGEGECIACCSMGVHVYPRQLIFLRRSDCLRCAVLLCLIVCLTLLASFFLPSHLLLKHVYE